MSDQPSEPSPRVILYTICYAAAFVVAIYSGFKFGFTGTHTPPGPFVVEMFVLPVGGILFFADAVTHRSTTVHKIGFTANLLIMLSVLIPVFAR